nr:hypothetical protein [Lamprobacter modestohalophilus]
MQVIAALCIGHVNQDTMKPTEQIHTLLTIGFTVVFPCDHWVIEQSVRIGEI